MTAFDREAVVERMAQSAWKAGLRYACQCNPRLAWEELCLGGREILLCEARAALAIAEEAVRGDCATPAEVEAVRAEVERLRSAAGYQAEAHTLRTSQKLLAELVRSWGYENKPNESNGSLIRRVLEDQRRQIKEGGDAIVAVADALGAPHYGAAEIVAEAEILRARVAELEGVLRPFADAAEAASIAGRPPWEFTGATPFEAALRSLATPPEDAR